MAVSKAIQSGETESTGTPKDILSGPLLPVFSISVVVLSTSIKSDKARTICQIISRPPNIYSDLPHLKLLSC